MVGIILVALVVGAASYGQVSLETPGWSDFVIPGLELPAGSHVDLSALNPEPAGKHGFIRVKDGKFQDDRGVPLRFYGTNVTGDSCFPDIEDGRKLAKRFRAMGFNCLRLHFMDANWIKDGIWEDVDKGTLKESTLVKLDHFIDACGKEGVYINVNLHVYRTYPGQPNPKGVTTFHAGKNIDRWYEEYIVCQEDYARQLMGRVNTANGRRYADDPAIMCVELNNENTMITDARASIAELPQSFRDTYDRLWTDWLKAKYKTTAELKKVWNRDVSPVGDVVVSGKNGWVVENAGGAESTLTLRQDGGCHWVATKSGTQDWNLQLQIKKIKLPPKMHTVRFRARSKTSSRISHWIMLDAAPWQGLGLMRHCNLIPEWQEFEIEGFVDVPVNDNFFRVNISLGNKPGDVEIEGYEIRPGGGKGLGEDESLETLVRVPVKNINKDQLEDYWQFIIDTEMNTTRRLIAFLKEQVKCKMPITDTQVSYGVIGGLRRESELSDYIDIHTYWQHPSYRRDESGKHIGFSIGNSAQVASKGGGAIPALSLWRVPGKPYTTSEYNAPAPSEYNADMFPLWSLMGCLQDWDGLFSYTYRDFGRDYANPVIRGYFHLIGRSSLLAHIPFGTLLYRQGRLSPLPRKTRLAIPFGRIGEYSRKWHSPPKLLEDCGGETIGAYSQQFEVVLDKSISEPVLHGGDGKALREADGTIVSSDGAVRTRPDDPEGAWLSLNIPSARLLTGHLGGRQFQVGDVSITVSSRPWPQGKPAFACISVISLDNKPLAESGKILLAASARTENSGVEWNDARNETKSWGKEPVLSETVPMSIVLPGDKDYEMTILDGNGFPVEKRLAKRGLAQVMPTDKSLWFLLEPKP